MNYLATERRKRSDLYTEPTRPRHLGQKYEISGRTGYIQSNDRSFFKGYQA